MNNNQLKDFNKIFADNKHTLFAMRNQCAVSNILGLKSSTEKMFTDLQKDFGTWRLAWGELNRFQRIANKDVNQMDDEKPSIAVPFTSSAWGQLPSYTSRSIQGSKKWYGVNGNSFIAAVEFGPKIKAYSLLAGGENGNPSSPHFFDQGQMYAEGKFKEVYFYRSDVLKHAVTSYHP